MIKRRKIKKKPIIIVLDIVIAILCVITVFAGVFAVASFNEELNYGYDADSFYYRLSDEAYGTLVEMYYANEATDEDADEELEQYYGVAKYFEAASYYKVYKENGDSQRAHEYMKKMEDAKEDMGELSFLSEKICGQLGI